MKGLIKYTDVHLRIRILIAEAGRKLHQTIEDERGEDSKNSNAFDVGGPPLRRHVDCHVKQMIV